MDSQVVSTADIPPSMIPLLKPDSNLLIWKSNFSLLMKPYGYMAFYEGTIKPPDALARNASAAEKSLHTMQCHQYELKKSLACAKLVFAIQQYPALHHIFQTPDAIEPDKLYAKILAEGPRVDSTLGQMKIIQKLSQLNQLTTESLKDYVHRLDALSTESAAFGKPLTDPEYLAYLQRGASQDLSSKLDTLLQIHTSVAAIKQALITQEELILVRNEATPAVIAASVVHQEVSGRPFSDRFSSGRGNPHGRGGPHGRGTFQNRRGGPRGFRRQTRVQMIYKAKGDQRPKSSTAVCWHCKKPGHKIQECRSYLNMVNQSQHTAGATSSSKVKQRHFAVQQEDTQSNPASTPQTSAVESTIPPGSIDYSSIYSSAMVEVVHSTSEAPTKHDQDTIKDLWFVDSGCTNHMIQDASYFENIRPYSAKVRVANGLQINAVGIGKVGLLDNVLLVPELAINLISVSQLDSEGFTTSFAQGEVTISSRKNPMLLIKGFLHGRMYAVLFVHFATAAMKLIQRLPSSLLDAIVWWHAKLGHINFRDLAIILNSSTDVNIRRQFTSHVPDITHMYFCPTCVKGKATKVPKGNDIQTEAVIRPELPLEPGSRWNVDLQGPVTPISYGGYRFVLVAIDYISKYTVVIGLKSKSDTSLALKYLVARVKIMQRSFREIKSDNGTEFLNKQVFELLAENAIHHITSAPYHPNQNGLVERCNRTIDEMARSILIHSLLPPYLWLEAMCYAAFTVNRIPSVSPLKLKA